MRVGDLGKGSGRGDRPGAVRATSRSAEGLLVAWPVLVPGPGLHRDGGHVRLRPVARRAGRDDEEDRRPDYVGAGRDRRGPGGLAGRALR